MYLEVNLSEGKNQLGELAEKGGETALALTNEIKKWQRSTKAENTKAVRSRGIVNRGQRPRAANDHERPATTSEGWTREHVLSLQLMYSQKGIKGWKNHLYLEKNRSLLTLDNWIQDTFLLSNFYSSCVNKLHRQLLFSIHLPLFWLISHLSSPAD